MTARATSLAKLHHSTLGLGGGSITRDGKHVVLPFSKELKYFEVNSVLLHRTFDLPEDGPNAEGGAMAKAEREAKAAAKVRGELLTQERK